MQLQGKKSQQSVPQYISYIKSLYRGLSTNGCGYLLPLWLMLLLLPPDQLLLLTFAFGGDTRFSTIISLVRLLVATSSDIIHIHTHTLTHTHPMITHTLVYERDLSSRSLPLQHLGQLEFQRLCLGFPDECGSCHITTQSSLTSENVHTHIYIVHISTYMYIHTYTLTCTLIHVHRATPAIHHVHMYAYISIHTYIYVNFYTHSETQTHTHTCTHTYLYIHTYM